MGILIKNIKCIGELEGNHDIYVHGTKIAGIDQVPAGFTLTDTVNGKGKLLIPGLINAHTHTYTSLFRNAIDDLAFEDWLHDHVIPYGNKLDEEDAYWGAMLSIVEMIKSGTTCYCDTHVHPEQEVRAVDVSGIRAVISRGLAGKDRTDAKGEARIAEAKSEMENWSDHSRMKFRLAPYNIYSCGEEYFKFVREEAQRMNIGVIIKVSESRKEFDECMSTHGCTPVAYLDKLGLLTEKTLATNCVFLTDSDIKILAERGVNVALSPVTSLKLGNGFAPASKLMAAGINVCLSTENVAGNNSVNMFHEMNMAALIYKGYEKNPQAVSAANVLDFTTKNAAKALGFEGVLGEIKVGCKADLTIIDIENEHFMPANNPLSAIAYSANGSEVDTVIVDGKILLDKKQLKTIDVEHVYYAANRIAKKIGIQKD